MYTRRRAEPEHGGEGSSPFLSFPFHSFPCLPSFSSLFSLLSSLFSLLSFSLLSFSLPLFSLLSSLFSLLSSLFSLLSSLFSLLSSLFSLLSSLFSSRHQTLQRTDQPTRRPTSRLLNVICRTADGRLTARAFQFTTPANELHGILSRV